MHVIFILDRCNIYDNEEEKGHKKRDKIFGCVEEDIRVHIEKKEG